MDLDHYGRQFRPVYLHRLCFTGQDRPATSTPPRKSVPAYMNGMATGADWMSAASFISMAGLISFMGRDGSFYLMGWTGGYVLLAMLFGPYLRKYGKFTIPQFMGDRYYSERHPRRLAALRHFRLLHLRGRPDARRRRGLLPLHGRSASTWALSSAWRWSFSTPPSAA